MVKTVIEYLLYTLAAIHKKCAWMFERSYHETTIVDALHHYFKKSPFCQNLASDGIICCTELLKCKTGQKRDPTDLNNKKTIRLDFALHKPNSNDKNVLALEFKKISQNGHVDKRRLKKDEEKVKSLTSYMDLNGNVRDYWVGISALINENIIDLKCYVKGELDSCLTRTYYYSHGTYNVGTKISRATDT